MTGEVEAAGDALTGAVIAGTVEGADIRANLQEQRSNGNCKNCGSALTGAFCSVCGQSAHIHRSLGTLGHDILHGVFHFEGKLWRTLPELLFHPGRLTRRYVDGERAKFVSPMALFLFTVFLTFAIFPFTSSTLFDDAGKATEPAAANWRDNVAAQAVVVESQIADLRAKRDALDATATQRAELDETIKGLAATRDGMIALSSGEWSKLAELDTQPKANTGAASVDPGFGSPAFKRRVTDAVNQVRENPGLLAYKLKANSYKYSWALIPLSVPFLWLMFFWRRDIHLYDHAIFVTYSLSFMMIFAIFLALLAAVGVSSSIWGTALTLFPPIHMYKQLRGTYRSSGFGAFVRTTLLLIVAILVLSIFSLLLLLIGALG